MRTTAVVAAALICFWHAPVSAAEDGATPQAAELVKAMGAIRIADSSEALIRSTLEGARRTDLVVQRVDAHAFPFYYERGDGVAFLLGKPLKDIDPARVKPTFSQVLWIMPPDYQGRIRPEDRQGSLRSPHLVLQAENGSIYAWPGPTEEILAILNVVAPLPAPVVKERNRLLAEADASVRKGLKALSLRYPQIRQPRDAQRVFDGASPAGTISLLLHNPQRETKVADASAKSSSDVFGVTVFVLQPSLTVTQVGTSTQLRNLRTAGQIGVSANDKGLEAELQALVDGALKPLKDLDSLLAPR